MKISYNIYLKNRNRKSATWTARIRQEGKTKDINLRTQDRSVAERWLRGARRALEEYNDAEAEGTATRELYDKVVKIDDVASHREASGKPVTVSEAIERYEVELRRKNYRESTIKTYEKNLEYLYDRSAPVETLADIESAMRKFDGKSSGTRHNYVSLMRGFLKFVRKKYGLNIEDEEIPAVKVESAKHQNHWTVWQMRRIIEKIAFRNRDGTVDDEKTEWTKIYFWLLATSGLRQGEAGTIRWSDIDWASSQLTLRETETKTRTSRKAPLQSYVLELLARKYREGSYAPSESVFNGRIPSHQGSRFHVLQRALADANSELPIQSQIPQGGLHTFRHSVSMVLYSPDENGIRPDIKTVSEILGHGEKVALKYYQSTRSPLEKTDLLNSKFGGSDMRSLVDDMVDEGMI